jgi:hypothetical protein
MNRRFVSEVNFDQGYQICARQKVDGLWPCGSAIALDKSGVAKKRPAAEVDTKNVLCQIHE